MKIRCLALLLLACLGVCAVAPTRGAAAPAARTAGAKGSHARFAVPFIADDYPKALAQARARKLPLFIEAWAPW